MGMRNERHFRMGMIVFAAAAIFMAGLTLGRWSVKHEWSYLLATGIYIASCTVTCITLVRQIKRDEAELRQMLREIEEAEARYREGDR
jgi:hypothetical protein